MDLQDPYFPGEVYNVQLKFVFAINAQLKH